MLFLRRFAPLSVAAWTSALAAHVTIDALGDVLLPHDAYDDVTHGSRAVAGIALPSASGLWRIARALSTLPATVAAAVRRIARRLFEPPLARFRRASRAHLRRIVFDPTSRTRRIGVALLVASLPLASFPTLARARTAPAAAPPAPSSEASPSAIDGIVVDNATGLPLSGAHVEIPPATTFVTTDRSGHFRLPVVPGPAVRVRVTLAGYQPTDSSPIDTASPPGLVTLSIQSAPNAGGLRTIGSTAIRASDSLQTSSTISRTLSPETLIQRGDWRAGDALRTLPGVNNAINGDTAALGDDLNLNLRGIGALETTNELDGHPIGQGIKGGFNYQLSPAFGLRDIEVIYGSGGSGLTGYDAIGGIIDSRTIDPTPDDRLGVTTGAGTFGKLSTNLTATGTVASKLGYAFDVGVGSLDGPYNNDYFYQPGAAYDPSATDPAVRGLAVYKDDSQAVTRTGLAKLVYALSPQTHVTLTSVHSSYWEDKTGNGDGDYLDAPVALTIGNNLLSSKSAKDPCPTGQFTATNANGVPFGTGPGGVPDGGSPCQTPQSYANDVTGLQGAGTSFQTFAFNDEALHLESDGARHAVRLDAFTSFYRDYQSRQFALPFVAAPGDNGSMSNTQVDESGLVASDNFLSENNELGFGVQYTNDAYDLSRNGKLSGSPVVHEQTEFVREAFHQPNSPISAYVTGYFKHATATNTSYIDPRASIVYRTKAGNDVFRLSAGATTAQPTSDLLGIGFVPGSLLAAGGGGGITCGRVNSVGNAPSSVLKPERGVDEELAYGHRFGGDNQIRAEFYTTNVYDKLYSSVTPLSITGTSFIDSATLAQAEAIVSAQCGGNPLDALGVTGTVNIGQLRAQGFTIGGREHVTRRAFIDYDYDTTSTALVSIPSIFLQRNLTYVQGAQLPRLPLHTIDGALEGLVGTVDLRYEVHAVSDDNTKRLGPYNFSTFRAGVPVGRGSFNVSVDNLFDQNAFIEGKLDEGEPLALNQYATKASYAQYTGAAATELFGLPYRSVYFSYGLSVK